LDECIPSQTELDIPFLHFPVGPQFLHVCGFEFFPVSSQDICSGGNRPQKSLPQVEQIEKGFATNPNIDISSGIYLSCLSPRPFRRNQKNGSFFEEVAVRSITPEEGRSGGWKQKSWEGKSSSMVAICFNQLGSIGFV